MPYRSKAQMRRFFAMEARGDLAKGTARRWAHETKSVEKLPARVRHAALARDRAKRGKSY